jgi:hypothetical protein
LKYGGIISNHPGWINVPNKYIQRGPFREQGSSVRRHFVHSTFFRCGTALRPDDRPGMVPKRGNPTHGRNGKRQTNPTPNKRETDKSQSREMTVAVITCGGRDTEIHEKRSPCFRHACARRIWVLKVRGPHLRDTAPPPSSGPSALGSSISREFSSLFLRLWTGDSEIGATNWIFRNFSRAGKSVLGGRRRVRN